MNTHLISELRVCVCVKKKLLNKLCQSCLESRDAGCSRAESGEIDRSVKYTITHGFFFVIYLSDFF